MEETLELEQLEKRIEWLDNERRNDKTLIAALQSRLENADTENAALRLRLGDIESDITRLNTLITRVEQYDLDINRIKTESKKRSPEIIWPLMEARSEDEKLNEHTRRFFSYFVMKAMHEDIDGIVPIIF